MMNSYFWFDLLVCGLLIFGIFRGRKRGMSMELLSLLEVLVIVVGGSKIYQPLGFKLCTAVNAMMDLVLCNVVVYVFFALVIHMVFSRIRTAVGEKLVSQDLFGKMEFYFGIGGGLLRYACVILMFLALLNAKPLNLQREQEDAKKRVDLYGKDYFPTLGTIQRQVFVESLSGKFVKEHLAFLLIQPPVPGSEPKPRDPKDTPARRRESALDEALGTPKK